VGAIPNPYVAPVASVRVGSALFVLDGSAIDRVELGGSSFSVFAGDQRRRGGTDGVGAAARFSRPQGIATDGVTLYVADTGNHTIRTVDPVTAAVHTIAGLAGVPGAVDGSGAAARFDEPYGAATDGVGQLWVTDSANATLRHVDLATATVTTVAGVAGVTGGADGIGAAARFARPFGVAYDGARLWISDANRVRRFVVASRRVTTLVALPPGQGVARELTGVASLGPYVYVATPTDDDETITSEVLRVTKFGGVVIRFLNPAPSTAYGVSTDGQALYVAGSPVVRVRVADASARPVGGVAEHGSVDGPAAKARFDTPIGLVSAGDALYVTDATADTVRRVSIATGRTSTLVSGLSSPHGITIDGGDLYVADSFESIDKVDAATGAVTPFATIASPAGSVNDLATDGTYLYVAHGDCAIYRVALADGAVGVFAGVPGACGLADGAPADARFGLTGCGVCGPAGITTDGVDLFVADTYNGAVRAVSIATGHVSTLVAPGAGVFRPFGIAYAAAGGALFVADPIEFALRRVSLDGAVTTVGDACSCAPLGYTGTPVGRTRLSDFYGVATDVHGRVFFTDGTGVALVEGVT
jgi:sugar lactone lactonase YvrE